MNQPSLVCGSVSHRSAERAVGWLRGQPGGREVTEAKVGGGEGEIVRLIAAASVTCRRDTE